METVDLKGFRKANKLTQDMLGEYIGMKKSFVSKVENGREKLPKGKLQKLLNNDMGWDVSLLVEERNFDEASDAINHLLNKKPDTGKIASILLELELLRAQLEEVKAEKEKYWEMICKLTEK